MSRRDYAGGAVATKLAGSITAASLVINITTSTGWPSGVNGPFFVVINRGGSSEEKILVTSRSANSLTVASISDRGVDGTSASSHNPDETVEHCFTAMDADEANAHINNTGLDAHTQYLNAARHDIAARHTFGAALGTPGAAADIGTVASAGVGAVPARSDHVHKIGTGAINAAGMLGADVVNQSAITPNAVGISELIDANVTLAKMAAASVDQTKMVAGLRVPVVCTSGTRPTGVEGLFIYETDTDQFRIYDGTNWILAGGPGAPRCELDNSAAQTIVSPSPLILSFDTEIVDIGGLHDGINPTRITFVEAGRYACGGYVAFPVNSTGERQLAIRRGGVDFLNVCTTPGSASFGSEISISGEHFFSAGQWIELYVNQNTGANLVVGISNNSPLFWARWVAPT